MPYTWPTPVSITTLNINTAYGVREATLLVWSVAAALSKSGSGLSPEYTQNAQAVALGTRAAEVYICDSLTQAAR